MGNICCSQKDCYNDSIIVNKVSVKKVIRELVSSRYLDTLNIENKIIYQNDKVIRSIMYYNSNITTNNNNTDIVSNFIEHNKMYEVFYDDNQQILTMNQYSENGEIIDEFYMIDDVLYHEGFRSHSTTIVDVELIRNSGQKTRKYDRKFEGQATIFHKGYRQFFGMFERGMKCGHGVEFYLQNQTIRCTGYWICNKLSKGFVFRKNGGVLFYEGAYFDYGKFKYATASCDTDNEKVVYKNNWNDMNRFDKNIVVYYENGHVYQNGVWNNNGFSNKLNANKNIFRITCYTKLHLKLCPYQEKLSCCTRGYYINSSSVFVGEVQDNTNGVGQIWSKIKGI